MWPLPLPIVYLKMKNYDEAIRWHQEVVKRQPKNAAAYANLGLAYGGKGSNRRRKSRIIKKRSNSNPMIR